MVSHHHILQVIKLVQSTEKMRQKKETEKGDRERKQKRKRPIRFFLYFCLFFCVVKKNPLYTNRHTDTQTIPTRSVFVV